MSDLHKWALIDKALEFGKPEPVETYSSSPHLYEELHIPAGTKGRLPHAKSAAAVLAARAAKASAAPAESSDSRPSRSRSRSRRSDDVKPPSSGTTEQPAAVDPAPAQDGATPHEEHVPGSGTHDGSGQPRRRRRRRGSRPATPSA